MRLSRIRIQNFRTFQNLDIALGEHAVILGPNKVGKSNLLHALRLILDPTLPDANRRLRSEDFWDGLVRPLKATDVIEISVDFTDFEGNKYLLALLGYCLISKEPMVARITYRWQPKAELAKAPTSDVDYEFVLFGGDSEKNKIGYDLRRWMPMDLFPALRDAESDLARWARSPLRPLLDRAAEKIDRKALDAIAKEIHATTEKVAKIGDLKEVVKDVNSQLLTMVGSGQALETALGFAPTDPDRLIRSMQLMIDAGARSISEASLGSANVLYLALKHLEHQYLIAEKERQYTFLAIEEPEAHLHPHLQRLIYRNYLRVRGTRQEESVARSILLTTHSPNIASVAPLSSIVLLRRSKNATIGCSLAALKLSDTELDDLERYIDVTRGDLFFANGVMLVEGDAEEFLIPVLARHCSEPVDLDELGISVCAIGGTNFGPFAQMLGPEGLAVPLAILTDFDPKDSAASQADADPSDGGPNASYGQNRVVNHIMTRLLKRSEWDKLSFDRILKLASSHGVFLNRFTFEVDLFQSGVHAFFHVAMKELTTNKAIIARFEGWAEDPDSLDPVRFLKDIESVGKGRFAQRLGSIIDMLDIDCCPPYIESALKHLRAALA